MKDLNKNSKVTKFIQRIELVHKRDIMFYQRRESQPFLKIVVALPTMVASCRGKFSCLFMSFTYISFCHGGVCDDFINMFICNDFAEVYCPQNFPHTCSSYRNTFTFGV